MKTYVQRDGDEVFSMQDGEGMGMIKLDVYRGQKIPTPNVSNVVVYQEPTWPRIVKSQVGGGPFCSEPA